MSLWLTALAVLAAWTITAMGLGLLLALHNHRSPNSSRMTRVRLTESTDGQHGAAA
ncbi:hypothetical protein ACIA8F_12740 [Streptomyces sp. NPDC051563]|uniref:hypothetical protein n=1 Tax=Streptomyces sp. NPDC051563 TaxID=3365659 RepID=UPI0037B7CB22